MFLFSNGLHFINDKYDKRAPLPGYCFVAAEGLSWLVSRCECSESEAVDVMERLMGNRFICHASGDLNKTFEDGFVLYCILFDKESKG